MGLEHLPSYHRAQSHGLVGNVQSSMNLVLIEATVGWRKFETSWLN